METEKKEDKRDDMTKYIAFSHFILFVVHSQDIATERE